MLYQLLGREENFSSILAHLARNVYIKKLLKPDLDIMIWLAVVAAIPPEAASNAVCKSNGDVERKMQGNSMKPVASKFPL